MEPVLEVVEGLKSRIGKSQSISGVFIYDSDRGFLCSDSGGKLTKEIEIFHPDLLKSLFKIAPAYGGGPDLYKGRAWFTGTLLKSSNFRAALSDVQAMSIECDGKKLIVI